MDEKEAEARPVMGTIFLVIHISDFQLYRPESVSLARQSHEISIEHPSVGLASLAQLYYIVGMSVVS